MRALRCRHCEDVALLPGGHSYYIGRAPRFPFAFTCFRCKKSNTYTARDWALTPITPGAVLEVDAKPNPMKDLGPRTPADLKGGA